MKTAAQMTKAQTRVLIAKDVIKQIKSKRMKPTEGWYFGLPNSASVREGDDLRDTIREQSKPCKVCAKGALFVAHVTRFDEVRITGEEVRCGLGEASVCRPLLGYFSQKQLDLIEIAYEGHTPFLCYESYSPSAALAFFKSHRAKGKRLIAIMQNVIENNGTFRP